MIGEFQGCQTPSRLNRTWACALISQMTDVWLQEGKGLVQSSVYEVTLSDLPVFRCWLCYWPAVWLWTSYCTSLCHCCPLYKLRNIRALTESLLTQVWQAANACCQPFHHHARGVPEQALEPPLELTTPIPGLLNYLPLSFPKSYELNHRIFSSGCYENDVLITCLNRNRRLTPSVAYFLKFLPSIISSPG